MAKPPEGIVERRELEGIVELVCAVPAGAAVPSCARPWPTSGCSLCSILAQLSQPRVCALGSA
ncbi:MAG: hypothetical protein GY856_52165 [bacterium]|nr:hypothetical protein [bacterium]